MLEKALGVSPPASEGQVRLDQGEVSVRSWLGQGYISGLLNTRVSIGQGGQSPGGCVWPRARLCLLGHIYGEIGRGRSPDVCVCGK